jgi:hypothetical protein
LYYDLSNQFRRFQGDAQMNVRLLSTLFLSSTLVILASCQSPSGPEATLSNLQVVSRPALSSGTDDYFIVMLQPDFHSNSLDYSVAIDRWCVLGVQPVTGSPGMSYTVTIDGKAISATTWRDTEEFFSCEYQKGVNSRIIEITVATEDGSTETVYTIEVQFNENGQDPIQKCFLDSLPMVKWITSYIYVSSRGSYFQKCIGLETVSPAPEFSSDNFTYSVHIGDSRCFAFQPFVNSEDVEVTVESNRLLRHENLVYPYSSTTDQYYIVDRSADSDVTDTVKVTVSSDECGISPVYNITIAR